MSIDYEISNIQSMISQQESINYELQSQLNELAYGINEASQRWESVTQHINGTLQEGASRVANSHEIALNAYELEGQVEKLYSLYKKMELANKKIRECKNRIYYEFANYRAVRKIVEALLNNIEISFVSDATLLKAVEKQHLQLPDYWLTCALLAIMSWKEDDRKSAEIALARACKLDLKNTSIFFFALYLRLGKCDTALKWFRSYQQCEHTGEDQLNVLLLFSVAGNTLREQSDSTLVNAVSQYIDQMLSECMAQAGYSEQDGVNQIIGWLNGMRRHEAIDYPVLCKYTLEKDYLFNQMNAARSVENYLEMILRTLHFTDEAKKAYLNAFIDDVIRRTNAAEKEVQNEITRNELIIHHKGDTAAADRDYQLYLEHNEQPFNLVYEIINWLFNPQEDIGETERMRMFIMTKSLSRKAIDTKVQDYRSRYKRSLAAKIDEYETTIDFTQSEQEMQKVDTFYAEKEQRLLHEIKIWPAFIAFGIAAALIVAAILLKQPIFIVGTVIGILAGLIKILLSSLQKKRITKDCAIEADNTKGIVDSMFKEFARYEHEYTQADAYYNRIVQEYSNI